MKVLAPLNNLEHIDDYMEAGAGEFYIGFFDKEWSDTFGDFADINRMSGFKEISNPYDLDTVLQIVKAIKAKGKEVYITFNSSIYSDEQLVFMKRYFERVKEAGVDGVIVSCIEQVILAREIGVPSVISTISGVYNKDIAIFYQEKGTKRIILPRDLAIAEIEAIKKAAPEAEYEIFMMRNGCSFSDSNCLGLHRKERCSICSSIKHAGKELRLKNNDFHSKNTAELNDMIYNNSFHNYACGLCGIYDFVEMGIAACKIVGRSDEWQYICKDIKIIKDNIDLAKRCGSKEEYLDQMHFPEDRVMMCKLGLSCYYPEVRF